jgi:hypothetical protein
VYSATYATTTEQSRYPVHTAYTLEDAAGKSLREIDNRTGLFDSQPALVPLPAGRYQVRALAPGGSYVVVPVVVEANRTTVVDLDGTAVPQGVADADMVRLPDGHVVGWRAQ